MEYNYKVLPPLAMSHSNAHTNIRYRMRHIRVISLRRLSTTEIPALFFTLHSLAPRSRLIYRSERHAPSRNPTWKKISSNQLRDIECSFESQFILRVWAEDSSKERLMLEWNVDLNELVGIENHRIGVVTSSNLVLFGLRNTGKSSLLFTDRTLVEGLRVVSHDTDPQYSHDFSATSVLQTYTLPTLQTLVPLIGALYTEERRKSTLRRKIETRLRRKYETHEEIGALKWSVVQLKKRRKECVLLVEKKKAKLQDICENVNSHQLSLQQNTEEFKANQLALEDRRDRHSNRKSNLLHQLNAITHRRLYLIKSLGTIYDIVIPPDSHALLGKIDPSQEIFLPTILGIPLPRQSTINQSYIPDIGINTSLGFVVHLISLLELILRLPLRFPVLFNGSQSLILNESTYSGDEFREVPLYFKRKGDLSINKLEHALFLLNHDLIQVRQHLGLNTIDFKATLKNIKNLFTESETCLKRLSEHRFAQHESRFNQGNQESIDLIFSDVTGGINGFQDIPVPELLTDDQS